jgi:hypothetical protein
MAAGIPEAHNVPQLQNPGFEASVANGAPIPGWDVSVDLGLKLDRSKSQIETLVVLK